MNVSVPWQSKSVPVVFSADSNTSASASGACFAISSTLDENIMLSASDSEELDMEKTFF